MDRESRDNFDIIDEIQEKLAIDVAPLSWPIGSGKDFIGCYDIINSRLEIMDRADRNIKANSVAIKGINDAVIEQYVPRDLIEKLKMEANSSEKKTKTRAVTAVLRLSSD